MPIILNLRIEGAPVLRGFDHYWSKVRELGRDGAEFTLADIVGWSNGSSRKTAGDFVRRLVDKGYAEAAGWRTENSRRHRTYRLLKRPTDTPTLGRGGTAGLQGCGVQQMWTAMRALDGFTIAELTMTASTDDHAVRYQTARDYVRRLINAGYLVGRSQRDPNLPHVYRLKPSMNTGPKAPKILRTKFIYDPNRGAIMGAAEAEEVRP